MGGTRSQGRSHGKRDSGSKLAEQPPSVLELACELGKVADACRRRGPWLEPASLSAAPTAQAGTSGSGAFQPMVLEGLKDLSPIHRGHPQTTPAETVARVREMALEHPAYGCNGIEAMLSLEDQQLSAITIHLSAPACADTLACAQAGQTGATHRPAQILNGYGLATLVACRPLGWGGFQTLQARF